MPISLRHIALLLGLTILVLWDGSVAVAGVKHVAHSKARHPKHAVARVVPAVIDTTCLDTVSLMTQNIVREINRWSSVRYKMGGISHKGADCSGFVVKVFQNTLTLQLPRTSREQAKVGERVGQDELQFGDLVFFYKNPKKKVKRISHVGIYIGEGNFVHSRKHKGVGIDALSEHYYANHFAFARRVGDITTARGDASPTAE